MKRYPFARLARITAPISAIAAIVYLVMAIGFDTFPFTGIIAGVLFAINMVAGITTHALTHKHVNFDNQFNRLQMFSGLHFLGGFGTGLAAFANADGMGIFPYAAFVPLGIMMVCLGIATYYYVKLGKAYKNIWEVQQIANANKRLTAALDCATMLSAPQRASIEQKAFSMSAEDKEALAREIEQYAEQEANKPDWLK